MECENKAPQNDKFATFSQTEIDAAILLLQLSSSSSSADSQDRNSHSHSSNSVSVSVLSKSQPSLGDAMIEDVLAEIEEDERLRRKIKRFRYVHDLYNVTHVLPPSPFKDN